MTIRPIREQLMAMSDDTYGQFQRKLCPTQHDIIGIRMPNLRRLAQSIAKEDWRAYLQSAQSDYYEEVLLQGLVIGYAHAELPEILRLTADFVPKIDNWAICDSFCSSLKIAKKYQPQVWDFLHAYGQSSAEFERRFAIVMLLDYYLDDAHIALVLPTLVAVRHPGYYVKMAVAWALSVSFIKFPQQTLPYLQGDDLDDFTHQKTLQKITDSYRVDPATKATIQDLKRARPSS